MPHLCLTAAACRFFVHFGICIIRMHLDRQLVGWKNKLHEQREVAVGRYFGAAPLRGHFAPRLAQCLPFEWPGSNATIHAGEPSLAKRLLQFRFFRVKRRERAPQILGLKTGSMRSGSGFTNQAAASARDKNRSRRRKPSSIRSMEVA